MKKIFKSPRTRILGAIASLLLFVPMLTLADLSPVLDSQNLYRIANLSNSATWGTSATADPGETLSFMVHIHNNVLETTAENVRVQVVLPANEVTSYTSSATVSASNASTVSGTTSFTLSRASRVEYIPGSTRLYNHNNQLERTLPDGIAAGGAGVDVGSYQGCWEYEKWVTFKARVVAQVTPPPPVIPPTPPTPPTPAPTPDSIQPHVAGTVTVAGPAESALGSLGAVGLYGAAVTWVKSKRRLRDAKRKKC